MKISLYFNSEYCCLFFIKLLIKRIVDLYGFFCKYQLIDMQLAEIGVYICA